MMKRKVDTYQQHLTIAKELGDRAGEKRAYGNLGNAYQSLGDVKQAIKYHNQDLSIAKELGDTAGEGGAYCNLGIAYRNLGDFKQAIKYHNQHLSIAKELGDKAGEGGAYGNLGNAFQSLGDFKQAIKYHNQHLSIAKELGEKAGEGRAYGNLGNAHQCLGDLKQAIKYHNQRLNIAKELGEKAGEGRAYGNLGNAYNSLGNFKQVIKYHNQHLSIAKELGDKAGEGRAYGSLGNAYQSLGDFKQAIKYHNQHLSIAKELGEKAGEGRAYSNLGVAFRSLGDFKQAIKYHNQRLRIANELGEKAGEGGAYGNLGNAYQSLGDFKQAITYHNKHLSIAKELGDKAGEGRAYGNLGNAFRCLGDFKQAIKYHNQRLSIAKELGEKAGEGGAYGNLGVAYQSLGDFKEAIKYHNQHLSIAKELGDKAGEGRAYGNLGVAFRSLGDFEEAIKYHNQRLSIAKELGDKAGEGRAYGNLGVAFDGLGDFKQAIKYHNQDLSIAKELGDKAGEGTSYYSLGYHFETSGSLEEALSYYRSSVKLYNEMSALLQSEDVWKISFRSFRHHAYTALLRTLVKLEKYDEALRVAEQGRAQALMDLMKTQYDTVASTSIEPDVTMTALLSDLSAQTVFIALESNKIQLWVLYKEGNFHFRQKEVAGKDAVTFLQCVRKDVFKENGIAARATCENRTLEKLRKKLPPSKEFDQETAETLPGINNSLRLFHDCIIGPIADLLQGDELIIVPDGPLCLAPYAAFLDDEFKYLSESVRIRILPSLTSLQLIAKSAKDYHRRSGVLLVGDPCVKEVTNELGESILPRLSYAKKEVKMIGDMLGISPLTGKDATKDEVLRRIGSVALVHIAAHGDMEAGEIALSPNPTRLSKIPEEKDFVLKMADVQAVKLRARLVVLSCCHSAQGKVTPEGVVGIARAFLGAGARSVLVALWAIDDEATMEFMKCFYEHLGRGRSASVALNRAMKFLRESEKFGAVKYWAPFVLIGDDVTIEFGENQ